MALAAAATGPAVSAGLAQVSREVNARGCKGLTAASPATPNTAELLQPQASAMPACASVSPSLSRGRRALLQLRFIAAGSWG